MFDLLLMSAQQYILSNGDAMRKPQETWEEKAEN
jgi:hypothetical protein